jgi:hypothetical protein
MFGKCCQARIKNCLLFFALPQIDLYYFRFLLTLEQMIDKLQSFRRIFNNIININEKQRRP